MMRPDRIPPDADADVLALAGIMSTASEEQIIQALALVDSLEERGPADRLIEPVRSYLRRSHPPHPLRFPRLLLHPLDGLIVSPTQWRRSDTTLPRNGLVRLAQHARNNLGEQLHELKDATAGSSTADRTLIEQLGRDLWPVAARILRRDIDAIPHLATEVGHSHQRHVTLVTIGLLSEAPAIATLIASTADGLLPPVADDLAALIDRTVVYHPDSLPSLVTVLMARVPHAVATLDSMEPGPHGSLVRAARDAAGTTLLRRLDEHRWLETSMAYGTVLDAGQTARSLLQFLGPFADARVWRTKVQRLRSRLETTCQARFDAGIQADVRDVLDSTQGRLDTPSVMSLEAVARGLRLLEESARAVSGASASNAALKQLSDAIGSTRYADRLSLADRARLVEILAGTDAALAVVNAA